MIETAGPAHAGAMALIHRQAVPPAEAWDEAAIAIQLALPGYFGLVAPTGFLLARVLAGEAEILNLAVIPQARRRGVGRALLHACLQSAQSRGAEALFLEVAVTNAAARGLYAGFGALSVGRRRAYYPDGGDALVLRIAIGVRPYE